MKPQNDNETRETDLLPFGVDAPVIVLGKAESERLAELVLNPSPPNEALKKLMRDKD
jgi:hypothetical protein